MTFNVDLYGAVVLTLSGICILLSIACWFIHRYEMKNRSQRKA